MKRIALLCVVGLALTACGSKSGVAATASEGGVFCGLGQTAKDDNDSLDALDGTDPAKIKLELSAAIDSLSAAVAKAPKDIVVTAQTLLSKEEALETLLKKYDYDVVKMAASDEGKTLLNDDSATTAGDAFKKYLSDKCGVATNDTVATDVTTPAEDTVATGETTPADDTILTDTVVTDDTGSDISIELGEGADAINKFLDFYELGTGSTLSDTDRTCIVDNLADKVTGDDLNEAIAGSPSDQLSLALGQAFITCNVSPQS